MASIYLLEFDDLDDCCHVAVKGATADPAIADGWRETYKSQPAYSIYGVERWRDLRLGGNRMEPTPSITQFETQALSITQRCESLTITDQISYDEAVRVRVGIHGFIQRFTEWIEPMRQTAYDAYQTVLGQKNAVLKPAQENLATVDRHILRWEDEQRRVEAEARRKAEEEAQRLADEERLKNAAAAEQAGMDAESVEQILQEPVAIIPRPVAQTYQRSSDLRTPDNWQAEVTDLAALIKAAAKDKSLRGYLLANQTALNRQAKANRTLEIPGVKWVNKRHIAAAPRRSY